MIEVSTIFHWMIEVSTIFSSRLESMNGRYYVMKALMKTNILNESTTKRDPKMINFDIFHQIHFDQKSPS